MEYAGQLVRGNWKSVMKAEFAAANAAGLRGVLEKIAEKSVQTVAEVVAAPPKEIVTAEISGIEITELDDAVNVLWKAGIYAESGMGCTGPIALVNEARHEAAKKILTEAGFVSE
jgi:hypothetical protein